MTDWHTAEVTPFPKSAQLMRGERRYRRRVASAKQWQRISAAKMGPCRVCSLRTDVDLHHLVWREHGGDDVEANIVPVCRSDHEALHRRSPATARLLLSRLSDAEYAYMITRAGEDYPERAYGIEYQR